MEMSLLRTLVYSNNITSDEYERLLQLQHKKNTLRDRFTSFIIADMMLHNMKPIDEESRFIFINEDRHIVVKLGDIENDLHMGLSYVNKLLDYIPNFSRTYGYIKAGPYFERSEHSLSYVVPGNEKSMISEYIPGNTLGKIVIEKEITPNDLASVIVQVVLSLKMLYDKTGMVHDDMHYDNIIISDYSPEDITYEKVLSSDMNARISVNRRATIIDYGSSSVGKGGVIQGIIDMMYIVYEKLNNWYYKDLYNRIKVVLDYVESSHYLDYNDYTLINGLLHSLSDMLDIEYTPDPILKRNIPSMSTYQISDTLDITSKEIEEYSNSVQSSISRSVITSTIYNVDSELAHVYGLIRLITLNKITNRSTNNVKNIELMNHILHNIIHNPYSTEISDIDISDVKEIKQRYNKLKSIAQYIRDLDIDTYYS
jgi:hypothetical protein